MPIHYFLSGLIEDYRKRALHVAFSFKDLLYRLFVFLLTTSLILWLSIFIYVSFYYSYMPAVSHVRPIHLEFSPCLEEAGLCSYPTSNVTLTLHRQLLMSGQAYKIIVDLDMPESETNQKLGMFMVHVKLTGQDGKLVANSRRSAMLRYRSLLLRLMSTLFYSPALLVGPMEEKQTVSVEMFSEFLESWDFPVTNIWIEIESRWVQLYSASLRIQADFTGLRYLMFYWPVSSATVGVASNAFMLSLLAGYVWYKLLKPNEVVVRVGVLNRIGTSPAALNSPSTSLPVPVVATVEPQPSSPSKTIEQRRAEAREKLLRDRQRKLGQGSPGSTERLRSLSYGSLPRIEELTPSSLSSADSSPFPKEDDADSSGLVMGSGVSSHVMEELGLQMRHRFSAPAETLVQETKEK